ncbi:MAG: maleylpyruvate isomerase family mycothiol-dependent enzyme [Pseudonocardiaceae bacterium]
MNRPSKALAWAVHGQVLFEQAAAGLDDVGGPSRLPGWTRGHVITHVTRNADGLVRLLTWARTGIETPMYASLEARAADIDAGAGRALAEQLVDLRTTGAAFAAAADKLSPAHWEATVRSRHGPVPASTIPWLRVREVWLHLVDLNVGVELDVLPDDIATALVRDVASWMTTRVSTRVEMQISGGEPVAFGPTTKAPVPVSGPVQELVGWLTGRSHGGRLIAPEGLPELPRWL